MIDYQKDFEKWLKTEKDLNTVTINGYIGKLKFVKKHLNIDISPETTTDLCLGNYSEDLKEVIHYKQGKKLTDHQYYNCNAALKKYNEYCKWRSSNNLSVEKNASGNKLSVIDIIAIIIVIAVVIYLL